MLFHVTHTHSWDACPYNDPERARDTFGKAFRELGDSEVDLVGAWVDPPAHKVFMVIDAPSPEAIEAALAPIIDVGYAETRPVVLAGDITQRRAAD